MVSPIIEVDGLSFRYPDGTPALDQVSLRVAPAKRSRWWDPTAAANRRCCCT
ncbi:MAG: hypothetical protein U0521_17770 [Anaerolineae bacterium]